MMIVMPRAPSVAVVLLVVAASLLSCSSSMANVMAKEIIEHAFDDSSTISQGGERTQEEETQKRQHSGLRRLQWWGPDGGSGGGMADLAFGLDEEEEYEHDVRQDHPDEEEAEGEEDHEQEEEHDHQPQPPLVSNLDLSRYALKFHQCHNGSPNERSSVIFRLCPDYGAFSNYAPIISSGDVCGPTCDIVYGEYKLDLEEYLFATVEYQRTQQEARCMACNEICSMDEDSDIRVALSSSPFFQMTIGECDTCLDDCSNIENLEENGYIDATQFLSCQMIYDPEDDGLSALWAGPVCVEDGSAIEIGVFQDEDCLEHVETLNVEDYLLDCDGYFLKVSYDLLRRVYQEESSSDSSSCVSCWSYDYYGQEDDNNSNNDNNNNNNHYGPPEDEEHHGDEDHNDHNNNNNSNGGYYDENGQWHDGSSGNNDNQNNNNNNNGNRNNGNNNNNYGNDYNSGARRRRFHGNNGNRRDLQQQQQQYPEMVDEWWFVWNNQQSIHGLEMCQTMYESSQKCEDFMGRTGPATTTGRRGGWWGRHCVDYV